MILRACLSGLALCACMVVGLAGFSQGDADAGVASPEATTAVDADGASPPRAAIAGENVLLVKLRQSGKTGLALLIISIVGFSFAFERFYNLRRKNVVPAGLTGAAEKLWAAGDFDGLKALAQSRPSTMSRVIGKLVDHRDASHADASGIASDIASREMRINLQRAYPLAVVATISLLLGLFGTVYGMMGAFESVALAGKMGDPSIMAGDIAFALVTTAMGLVIAVPALACYHFFRIKTNILALALEEQVNHLIIRWFPFSGKASE